MFNNLRSAATGSTASAILAKIKSDFANPSSSSSLDKPGSSSTNLADLANATSLATQSSATSANMSTRVICLSLPLNPPHVQNTPVVDPALFLDTTQALKESVVAALDGIVREREETVRKGETLMTMSGPSNHNLHGGESGGTGTWNWTRFFQAKESLALSFEKLGLWEDALLTYDELEASMAQATRDTSSFKLGCEKISQDLNPILPPHLLHPADSSSSATRLAQSYPPPSSHFSIFDYHTYLFRRQTEVLLKCINMGVHSLAGKPAAIEVAERGLRWVVGMGRWLRENSVSPPWRPLYMPFWISSWSS